MNVANLSNLSLIAIVNYLQNKLIDNN